MINYDGVTRGAQVTGVAVASLSLTWISLVLRMYTRLGVLRFWGWEDTLTVAAVVVFTTLCSLCLRDTVYGLGAHMFNITHGSLEIGFKIIFICELLYVASTAMTKLSVAAFYLRLSSKKYQKITIYLNCAVVCIFSTVYFFFLLFQCTPINFLWTRYTHGTGHCFRSPVLSAVTYTHAGISALTDWIFGILPIFFVWRLRMDGRTKLSVVLILSLGFFASTATIVRIVYIKQLTETADYSWEGINLVKWSMVEPAIAITAMNIATLRPMFKDFFKFASKRRFDPTLDSDTRDSGDSRVGLQKSSLDSSLYSPEFAHLMGLSRVGVTTQITAGGNKSEKDFMRRRFGTKSRSKSRQHANESETELNRFSEGPSTPVDLDWNSGIKTTTTTVFTSD